MESISTPAQPSRTQFSLRTIFVVIGAACLLLAPMHWFGVPYLISAALSVGLIVGCSLGYRSAGPLAILFASIGAGTGLFVVMALVAFFFHALANLVACVILVPFKPRTRTFAMALAGVMAAAYGFLFWEGAATIQKIRRLQAEYPLVSLTDRLAFERTQNASETSAEPISLGAQVESDLNAQDITPVAYYSRSQALEDLHENYHREFIRAAGFGYMRMPSLAYRLIDIEKPHSLTFPAPVHVTQSPSQQEWQEVHRVAVTDYVSRERIGYVKSRDQIAGFESHRFAQVRNNWKSDYDCPPRYWQVTRLELVGLLREAPHVYTAETLPPADQLAGAPHRPLNDFETAALQQLISQQDVVVDQQPDRIRMLGALRAGTTCLVCHEGQRGKLLGAFSYQIEPIASIAPTSVGDTANLPGGTP